MFFATWVTKCDVDQFKAILAAEIIKALDRDGLASRRAGPHWDCGSGLLAHPQRRSGRFTVDRLMSIINRLGHESK